MPDHRNERVVFETKTSAQPDTCLAFLFRSQATARLERFSTSCATWTLERLEFRNEPSLSRVFVFPSPAPAEPPAGLWISNLRELALESLWCRPEEPWVEIARFGWAGYSFNALHERSFSSSGGALDGPRDHDWLDFSQRTGIEASALCALDWPGLSGMWGPTHGAMLARREAGAISAATASGKNPSQPKRPKKV
jgi:hypothetical protein